MKFNDLFLTHLLSNKKLPFALSISQFLPTEFPLHPHAPENMLSLLASGYINSFYPYQYELKDFPSFCIILSVKGSGLFEAKQKVQRLCPGTLLFMDCKIKHKICAEKNSWEFYQLFLEETGSSFFYEQFTSRQGNTVMLSLSPYILSLLNRLVAIPQSSDKDILFVNHRLLTNLLTTALLQKSEHSDDYAPSYLRKMKKIMDTQYAAAHSLAQFEETFGISRYRLSKEFHKYYKEPPLQYLNRRRIEEAKKLLQDPSMAVYKAGRLVGIDNTTHFIHLFQKYTGTTPVTFRRSLFS